MDILYPTNDFIEARGLPGGCSSQAAAASPVDFFVELGAKGATNSFKTTNVKQPKWNQDFVFGLTKEPNQESLQLKVCDSQGQMVGEADVPLEKYASESGFHDEWHTLRCMSGKRAAVSPLNGDRPEIHTSIYFAKSQNKPQSSSLVQPTARKPIACPQPRYKDPIYQFKQMYMPQEGSNWDSRSLLVDRPPTH